jgi:phosphohistidine phosphatase SixA
MIVTMSSCRLVISRALQVFCFVAALAVSLIAGAQVGPVSTEDLAGLELVDAMRDGGLVLAIRHADTGGMTCDSSYRVGDRAGQRNISPLGEEQSRRLGDAIRDLEVPIDLPVLTGPVYRARDTAEFAFGADNVEVTDSLLADDYAGRRVSWVISEHRRLLNESPAEGVNRIIIGHRTPILMALDGRLSRLLYPEGAAIVLRPGADRPEILGILNFAPLPNPGIDRC